MTNLSRKTRILIVEDHPLVREGLEAIISRHDDLVVVGQADSVRDAIDIIKREQPHLAIVDISLREGSGLDLIREIKEASPGTRVLVSSMHDEVVYAQRALQAGAMGYVHKQEGSQKIVDGIRTIMDGGIVVSQKVNDRLLARAAQKGGDLQQSPVSSLSDRELEILELIGDGLSKAKIAEKLHISTKTIDTHRQNIKGKLNLADFNELMRFATQWRMEEQ